MLQYFWDILLGAKTSIPINNWEYTAILEVDSIYCIIKGILRTTNVSCILPTTRDIIKP